MRKFKGEDFDICLILSYFFVFLSRFCIALCRFTVALSQVCVSVADLCSSSCLSDREQNLNKKKRAGLEAQCAQDLLYWSDIMG